MSGQQDIPTFGSDEGKTASVVRCSVDASHIGLRETFEEVGGCPYCLHTPDERVAALQKKSSIGRRARRTT